MLTEQFQEIYKTLLAISTHPAMFVDEKKLVELAQKALATADVKEMWVTLVDIALRQGFHENEKRIVHLAQLAIRQLLLQLKMLDEVSPQ